MYNFQQKAFNNNDLEFRVNFMASYDNFSMFFIERGSKSPNQQSTDVVDNQQQMNMICTSDSIAQSSAIDVSTGQMIPEQEIASENGQDYVLLTPLTTVKESENMNIESSENTYIPANQILAESVRGLFVSTDSQSSFKSAEGSTFTEDYYDPNDDELTSEYSKRRRITYDEDGEKIDPFSDECRIPLPGCIDGPYLDSKTFVRKRNERERARVRSVNGGFERLRAHLPFDGDNKHRKLSKVETLQCAIQYIHHLQSILDDN